MRFVGITGVVYDSSENRGEFEWDISNFFSLSRKGGDYYESPEFSFNNTLWCLSVYSDGVVPNQPSGWMDLSLDRKDSGPPITLQFTLGIKGVEGVGKKEEGKSQFSKHNLTFYFHEFLSRQVLKDHKLLLVPNEVLTISCSMASIVPSNTENASIQTDEEFSDAKSLSKENHSIEKHGLEKVIEDMGRLLVSGENSDITVQVSNTQFKVHRAILSARSPVISAMFRHETTEKTSNKITIRDCEPDVFKEFLHYIYSGSVQFLTEQNVFNLYRIADKYLADDLRQQCLELIQNILCIQTFCETVKLSLAYRERDLLKLVINFASKNISLILCSVEWQNFISEYPTAANEILIKCFGPQKEAKIKPKR